MGRKRECHLIERETLYMEGQDSQRMKEYFTILARGWPNQKAQTIFYELTLFSSLESIKKFMEFINQVSLFVVIF